MITNIDGNLSNRIVPDARQTPHPPATQDGLEDAVRLDVRYEWTSEALIQADDAAAIATAKALLASGQLDTVENIRQAAREIIELGF